MFVQINEENQSFIENPEKDYEIVDLSNKKKDNKNFVTKSDVDDVLEEKDFIHNEKFNKVFIKPIYDSLSSYFDKLLNINRKEIVDEGLTKIQKNRLNIKNGLDTVELLNAQEDIFSLGFSGFEGTLNIKLEGLTINLSTDYNRQYFNSIIKIMIRISQ